MAEMLIYKTKVQELGKKAGLRVSSGFYTALDKKVRELIKKAIENAKKANRKTLSAEHLP